LTRFSVTAAQLSDAGVKRISIGGSLSRFALGAFLKAAREMKDQGAFTFVRDAVPSKELKAAFVRGAAAADATVPVPAQP
jgi:2-methylisocitrate lyase-like PEP mutase family enzyme